MKCKLRITSIYEQVCGNSGRRRKPRVHSVVRPKSFRAGRLMQMTEQPPVHTKHVRGHSRPKKNPASSMPLPLRQSPLALRETSTWTSSEQPRAVQYRGQPTSQIPRSQDRSTASLGGDDRRSNGQSTSLGSTIRKCQSECFGSKPCTGAHSSPTGPLGIHFLQSMNSMASSELTRKIRKCLHSLHLARYATRG
jgi:hypothetical protein